MVVVQYLVVCSFVVLVVVIVNVRIDGKDPEGKRKRNTTTKKSCLTSHDMLQERQHPIISATFQMFAICKSCFNNSHSVF